MDRLEQGMGVPRVRLDRKPASYHLAYLAFRCMLCGFTRLTDFALAFVSRFKMGFFVWLLFSGGGSSRHLKAILAMCFSKNWTKVIAV